MLAAVAVTVLVLGTRAMHLDGLADTADGLSAGYDRERALEVMRRSDIGPSGVAAVTLALLLDVAALTTLLATWRGAALAGVAVLRAAQLLAWACARGVPSARPDGLGATVAGTVGRSTLIAGTVAMAAFSAAAALPGRSAPGGPDRWSSPRPCVAGSARGAPRASAASAGSPVTSSGRWSRSGFAVALTTAALVLPHAG